MMEHHTAIRKNPGSGSGEIIGIYRHYNPYTTCITHIYASADSMCPSHIWYTSTYCGWASEILHQLISDLPHYLQVFYHPKWCRISQPPRNLSYWSDSGDRRCISQFSCDPAVPESSSDPQQIFASQPHITGNIQNECTLLHNFMW